MLEQHCHSLDQQYCSNRENLSTIVDMPVSTCHNRLLHVAMMTEQCCNGIVIFAEQHFVDNVVHAGRPAQQKCIQYINI